MKEEGKRTFNALVAHVVIKELMFSNLDYFSKDILTNHQNMLKFMNFALNKAAEIALEEADIYEHPIDKVQLLDISMALMVIFHTGIMALDYRKKHLLVWSWR